MMGNHFLPYDIGGVIRVARDDGFSHLLQPQNPQNHRVVSGVFQQFLKGSLVNGD